MTKRVITGVAGFIGSTIAQRLLDAGDEVIGVDCLTDYYDERIKRNNLKPLLDSDRFTFIEKNILDVDWARALDGASVVYHCAAQAGVRASWGKTFEEYTQHNILATQTLLEALKGTGVRCVYSSSSSVYGETTLLPMREDHLPKPQSPYGVTKLAAEHLCVLYWKNFKVPTVSLRYFTVYGPKQRPDMAFHRFLKSALRGEPINLYDDGEQTRDFTFIEDIVQANLNAGQFGKEGSVYNIGGGSRISVNGVLKLMEKVLNRPIQIRRHAAQKGDVKHTYADTSLARAEIKYDPKFTLEEGLAREAQWLEERMSILV